jgi:hypothetical protein
MNFRRHQGQLLPDFEIFLFGNENVAVAATGVRQIRTQADVGHRNRRVVATWTPMRRKWWLAVTRDCASGVAVLGRGGSM